MTAFTQTQVSAIVDEARTAARQAARKWFKEQMNGRDSLPCGFAWVRILGVKGNTKLGRQLKQAGVEQNWNREFEIWNPGEMPVQNVDAHSAGAHAAAEVFSKYGFVAYAGSRLD